MNRTFDLVCIAGAAILLLALVARFFLLDPLTEVRNLKTPAVPVREMAARLRAVGLAWDSADVTSRPGEYLMTWHFANLRRTERREGGAWTATQGNLCLSLAGAHLWRVQGGGDLADLQFDLVDPGSNAVPAD